MKYVLKLTAKMNCVVLLGTMFLFSCNYKSNTKVANLELKNLVLYEPCQNSLLKSVVRMPHINTLTLPPKSFHARDFLIVLFKCNLNYLVCPDKIMSYFITS